MRFVELTPGLVDLRTGPMPHPPTGHARVRVHACGICGSDLHLLHGMRLPRGVDYPVRPGHEVAGTVQELGEPPGPHSPAVGDLVVLHPLAPCERCPRCVSGHLRQCDDARALGIHAAGGLADEVVWPTSRMVVATGIADDAAAILADAGATAYHAWTDAAVEPGGSLCVVGAGGVGTQLLKIARALDPGVTLAAVVGSEASARRIADLGVHVEIGVDDAVRKLREGFGRFDAVADFSGVAEAPAQGIRLLRRGGRLVLGSVLEAELRLGPATAVQTKELQVIGVYSSSIDDLRAVVHLARNGQLDLDDTVTHVFSLDETADGLKLMEARPPGMLRVVVRPSGTDTP